MDLLGFPDRAAGWRTMRVVRGFILSREGLFLSAPLPPGLVRLVALGDRDDASLRGNFFPSDLLFIKCFCQSNSAI